MYPIMLSIVETYNSIVGETGAYWDNFHIFHLAERRFCLSLDSMVQYIRVFCFTYCLLVRTLWLEVERYSGDSRTGSQLSQYAPIAGHIGTGVGHFGTICYQ